MNLEPHCNILHNELDIPTDNFGEILPDLCRNFIKKYERNSDVDPLLLSTDLKEVLSKISVYTQYTLQTIVKYASLSKLETLVRGITEGQSIILSYLASVVGASLEDKYNSIKKVESITCRMFERCQNCSKPLQQSEIDNIQKSLGMKFRDVHEYFEQDFSEMQRLSEADLIFQKKSLHLDGIAEEEYMYRLEKMKENVACTIEHVSQSLDNILIFEQKFNEIKEYHYQLNKDYRESHRKFNSKEYMVNLSSYFYNLIKNLERKLDKIRPSASAAQATQTNVKLYGPEEMEELTNVAVKADNERKQVEIYNSSLEQQLVELKSKCKMLQDNYAAIKLEKQAYHEKIKCLEIDIEFQQDKQTLNRRSILSSEAFVENLKQLQANPPDNPPNTPSQLIEQQQMPTEHKVTSQRTDKSIMEEEPMDEQAQDSSLNRKQSKIALSYTYGRKKSSMLDPFRGRKPNGRIIGDRQPQINKFINRKYSVQEGDTDVLYFNKKSGKEGSDNIKQHVKSMVKPNKGKNSGGSSMSSLRSSMQEGSGGPNTKELHINREVSVRINMRNSKKFPKTNRISRYQSDMFEAEFESIDEVSEAAFDLHLRKVYNSLQKDENKNVQINTYEDFKTKFETFISHFHAEKDDHVAHSAFRQLDLHQGDPNNAPYTRNVNQGFLFGKENKKGQQFLKYFGDGEETQQKSHLPKKTANGILSWSRIKTEGTELPNAIIKQPMKQKRKSSNPAPNLPSSARSPISKKDEPLKLPILPSLQKQPILQEGTIPSPAVWPSALFNEHDILTVFNSIETACHLTQNFLKHRKSLSCSPQFPSTLHPNELGFMKRLLTRMASLHLSNPVGYQKLKLFLVRPYDLVISQMADLGAVAKSGVQANAIRESLCNVMMLHRNCTPRGQICRHLNYLMGKVGSLGSQGSCPAEA